MSSFTLKALAVAAAVGSAVAQRPDNTTICDYYTTALLKNNTAANQKTLLTVVVNTAVIGNYTIEGVSNVGVNVPGILTAGTFNGTYVNLAPYFDGGFASTNTGGDSGMAVNFLDGGGATPLMNNTAANDTSSNQYILLSHLYEYFGGLLGCSEQGMTGYDAYSGSGSMYEVHKFMDLNAYEVGYFIEQVALSAASFGVAASDLEVVGTALNSLFGYSCSPNTTVIPDQGAQLQSICIGTDCPEAANATCSSYGNATAPAVADSALVGNATLTATSTASMTAETGAASKTASSSATSTKSGASASSTKNAATTAGLSAAAVLGAAAALFL